jgi:hypothetical protein
MSLWTPGGEHEVPREPTPQQQPQNQSQSGEAENVEDLPGFDELSPEQQEQARAMAAEMAEAQRRIAETPAEEVVANHVMGLYELAAIHLNNAAPAEAQIAIDAMTAVTTSLQGRLGENEPVLREALQQVQVAFVQITNALAEQDGEQPAE